MRKISALLLPFSLLILSNISKITAHSGGHPEPTNLGFWTLAFLGTTATLVSLFSGLLTYPYFVKNNDSFTIVQLQGLAIGIVVFLFYDFLSLSSFLGIHTANIFDILLLLGVFLFIFMLFTFLEDSKRMTDATNFWLAGIMLHAIAEGIIMGHNFTFGVTVLFDIFAILGFLLHKFAEGMTLVILFRLQDLEQKDTEKQNDLINPERTKLSYLAKLAFVAGIPTFVGMIIAAISLQGNTGFNDIIQPILYAVSLGVIIFSLPAFMNIKLENRSKSRLWILIGFMILYFGGLLHEL